MAKVKTNKLTGLALDWVVSAVVENSRRFPIWIDGKPDSYANYSTDWSQGGPIIDRLHIRTEWSALWECWLAYDLRHAGLAFPGATRLIAAMRCYVTSKLGDEVEVPDELL